MKSSYRVDGREHARRPSPRNGNCAGERPDSKPSGKALGAHHRVSENASDTEPARLLAAIVVDAADDQCS